MVICLAIGLSSMMYHIVVSYLKGLAYTTVSSNNGDSVTIFRNILQDFVLKFVQVESNIYIVDQPCPLSNIHCCLLILFES